MTGISALVFYSTNLFQMAGIPLSTSQFVTIGVGGIIFIMTLVSVCLVDKLGRRTLFLVGSIGQILCLVVMTISLNLEDNSTPGKYKLENYYNRFTARLPMHSPHQYLLRLLINIPPQTK